MKVEEVLRAEAGLNPRKELGFVVDVAETKKCNSSVVLTQTTKKQIEVYIEHIREKLETKFSPYLFGKMVNIDKIS